MAVFETWLKSDLQKAVQVKSIQGNLFSADNAGNLIGVVVTDGGSPAEITGTVTAYIIRADGATVVTTGSISGNRVSVTLPASAYAVVGQASIVIKVGTTTVGACTIYVYRSTTDTIVDPGSVIPSIEELLEQVEACRTATTNANTAATGANTAASEATTKAGLAETAAGNANTAAGKINNMTAEATTLSAGSQATVSVTEVDGHKHIIFGVPKGVSGNETIDDTAGEGDTDKVWSADKSYAEITPLKNNVIVESVSGSIASFADGADGMPLRSLSVAIEPVQDLHGYDSPWPAGGGKNLLNNTAQTITKDGITFTVNSDGTVNVNGTATNNTELVLTTNAVETAGNYIVNGCPSGGSSETYWINIRITFDSTSAWRQDYGSGITLTNATIQNVGVYIKLGATVNNVLFKPMIRLATETDPTFAPYSNICPISGWTGANVSRRGKNLIPPIPTTTSRYGVTFSQDGNHINIYSESAPTGNASINLFTGVLPAGVYTFNGMAGESNTSWRTAYRFGSNAWTYNSDINQTITSDGKSTLQINLFAYPAYGAFNNVKVQYQLETGSASTAHEAYHGNTYPISWQTEAGTVYGGTLTIHQDGSGELVVDRGIADLGELNYENDGNDRMLTTGLNGIAVGKPSNEIADMLLSIYKAVSNNSTYAHTSDMSASMGPSGNMYIYDSRYTIASEFKAAVAGETICYKLATPVTYQLTPQEIRTLLGQNNIWADTGDVTVSYPADTKLYIDARVAELQALILENISNS